MPYNPFECRSVSDVEDLIRTGGAEGLGRMFFMAGSNDIFRAVTGAQGRNEF